MRHVLPEVLRTSPLTARQAIVWLRFATRWIGPGFHPDDSMLDYAGSLVTKSQLVRLEQGLTACHALLGQHRRDPCDVAIKVQRRLLGLPKPE